VVITNLIYGIWCDADVRIAQGKVTNREVVQSCVRGLGSACVRYESPAAANIQA
jgi:hypothetical protein